MIERLLSPQWSKSAQGVMSGHDGGNQARNADNGDGTFDIIG
ncbi:hypothetical protein QE372_002902 [Agrobacterium pusense]|nr:hypothetical protein [Agrobacterium pusense]